MNRAVVGLGSCGVAAGGEGVVAALRQSIHELGIDTALATTGCVGMCYREVLVRLESPELGACLYGNVTVDNLSALLVEHFKHHRISEELLVWRSNEDSDDRRFLDPQDRIVLRNCGHIDPTSLEEYREHRGYLGLKRALEISPQDVIDEIKASGLQGRGGAGFRAGVKWDLARHANGGAAQDTRYVICNADEGDPGAFMDRNIIEGDPFSVLEGLTLAGYAVGAREGYIYVRDEYPLAVQRLEGALALARQDGLLGENIMGTGFSFDVHIHRGAGAFVCGEETALIASIEGQRGYPRIRPPYPVEQGLFGRPTVINNVETLANVSWIMSNSAAAFRLRGTATSPGTKVFSLVGQVRRSGMVEVPMGTTIRTIVEEIGGGTPKRPIKAVQIGGPAGGCLPVSLFDTPIDYDSLKHTGAIMGSGGLVVLDAATCMVDIARYFLEFNSCESCGKCTFCRIGTRRMLEMLERMCAGKARKNDLEELEALAEQVKGHSLCGLGKAAPNPVSTTLRYFRAEYEAHMKGVCPAGRCRDLITFSIDQTACEGCTLCLDQCPMDAISITKGDIPLKIDAEFCSRCNGCFDVCPFSAVMVR